MAIGILSAFDNEAYDMAIFHLEREPTLTSAKVIESLKAVEQQGRDSTEIGSEGYRRKRRSNLLLLSPIRACQGSLLRLALDFEREGLCQEESKRQTTSEKR